MSVSTTSTELPKTISDNGRVPESRMGKPTEVQERIRLLIHADSGGRAQRRARVKGLVDGNPPYRYADLVNAGTPQRCNVNWRTAESYLSSARGAFYDVYSEVPSYATVRTKEGGTRHQEQWSKIITEEFDTLLKSDPCFDYHHQISQQDMCLYGCGPLMFEDTTDWRNVSVLHRNLLVPDMAPSDVNQWDECAVLVEYDVVKLYKFIRNEASAKQLGWRPAGVKDALRKASVRSDGDGRQNSWEWNQQQLKNSSSLHNAQSKVVKCAHYFVREFPEDDDDDGKITHAIVVIATGEEGTNKDTDFLFKQVGRFDNWRQVIHPMYLDNDGGGYHHSVSGLGVKMFAAMEAQNRLLCNAFDKAFAPKQLFKPTTAQASEEMSVVHLGDYGKVPRDWEAVQMPVGSFMDEVLILNRELSGMIAANLSAFRQNLSKDTGNPITAKEAGLRASEQTRLNRTQLNHFFAQQDWLYEEKYRRASSAEANSKLPGGKMAKEFQDKCKERGVPLTALRNFESVKSTRVIGQGSPFLRQEVTQEFLATSQLNPSAAGKRNILFDYYASRAGVSLASRYLPEIGPQPEQTDQLAVATLQVAAARNGTAPVVSASQDNAVFATTFLEAAGAAFGSLEQGADPMQVYQFVDTLMPAAQQHIEALGQDPRMEKLAKQLAADWKKIAGLHDALGKRIQAQQQQQQEAAMKQQQAQQMEAGIDPEVRLQQAKIVSDARRKDTKQSFDLRRKEEAHRQKLSLDDARVASEITLQARKAEAAATQQE